MADSLVVERKEKKEPYWISYIKGRIKKKKNFLAVLSGATGSGKSWSALNVCYMVDPDFSPERIVFSMKELMRLINEGKLKNGSAILWDECGVDISHRSWQSLVNKLINFLMQTFRHQQLILIFTVPFLDFVDASTRKLFHAEMQTVKINYKERAVVLKPHLIQFNGRNRKFYYKYLRLSTKLGVAPIKSWKVYAPPSWLIEAYEIKKKEFTSALNKDIEQQLEHLEEQKQEGGRKPLTAIQQRIMKLMARYNDVDKVAEEFGVTKRNVYFHIAQSKKKGYQIDEFTEESLRNKELLEI